MVQTLTRSTRVSTGLTGTVGAVGARPSNPDALVPPQLSGLAGLGSQRTGGHSVARQLQDLPASTQSWRLEDSRLQTGTDGDEPEVPTAARGHIRALNGGSAT